MKPLMIIGTGCAGYRLAQAVRRLDSEREIHLFTEDDGAFYSKPSLSNAWRMQKTADALVLNTAEQMQQQCQATVHTHCTIQSIDATCRQINTAEGHVYEYGTLVLATGASPRTACLPPAVAQHCLSVNQLADYRALRARCAEPQRICIIGAGLVGCEMANDFLAAGHQVSLVAATTHPLMPLLPTAAALVMQQALIDAGVQCHLAQTVVSVEKSDGHYLVQTQAGQVLEADTVFSAVGLQANTSLAAAAGLQVNHGVVVDSYGRTSDPNIYALGDVAELYGQLRFYIAPITASINSMAQTLCGHQQAITLPPMAVNIKTTLCPTVVCAPSPQVSGQWVLQEAGPDLVAVHRDQGRLQGFVLMHQAVKQRAQWLQQLAAEAAPASPS